MKAKKLMSENSFVVKDVLFIRVIRLEIEEGSKIDHGKNPIKITGIK